MPSFDLITEEQLKTLRRLARQGESIIAGELVALGWPAPDGAIYYGHTQLDALPNFKPLQDRGLKIEARVATGYFLDLPLQAEIDDDTVPLELVDHDREITRLLLTHGEGIPVEVYYYLPQIDLLVSPWWGHLRPPTEGGGVILKCSAASGFRSSLLNLPRRILFAGCQAFFGGLLKTLAEAEDNDCPYSIHLGGSMGLLNPDTDEPFTSCPRTSESVCIARLGDAKSFLAAQTVIESIVNNQTKGPALLATSKGNETSLKDPLRVIFGERLVRDAQPSAYSKQFNTNHPDQGFVRAVFPMSEGPIQSMTECSVNDSLIGFEHLNVRLGDRRQPATGFSPNFTNMSGTSHFFAVYGQVNPAGYNASNLKGKARIRGLRNIRRYTDEETFTEEYTTNRALCLLEMERNPRWGRGKKMSRKVIQDWIDLAAWCDETVQYRLASGTVQAGTRSTFNAELLGRTTQQQISDVCLFGRFGLPFRHNGYERIVALKKEVIDENVPVFTDQTAFSNICIDATGDSQLFYSYKSDAELPNQIVFTFEDAAHGNIQRPLTFDDQAAQQRAGEALGDFQIHVVSKPYSALGVVYEGEAIRLGQMLLDLGEFDSGGLRNNLTVRFLTPFYEAMNLHRYKVIRVLSPKLDYFREAFGFEYFRVMNRRRRGDLQVEVIAQAYPVEYYEQMENIEEPNPLGGGVGLLNPGGGSGDRPESIGFGSLGYNYDRIYGRLQESLL